MKVSRKFAKTSALALLLSAASLLLPLQGCMFLPNRLDPSMYPPRPAKSLTDRAVCLLALDGNIAFGKEEVRLTRESFERIGADVVTVGDGSGDSPVTLADLRVGMEKVKNTGKMMTLLILGHADVINGKYVYYTSNDQMIKAEDLYKTVSEVIGNRPISTIVTCCWGEAGTWEADILPKGSTMQSFYDPTHEANPLQIASMLIAINDVPSVAGNLSAEDFRKVFVIVNPETKIPSIFVSDGSRSPYRAGEKADNKEAALTLSSLE